MKRNVWITGFLFALAVSAGLGAANLYFGELNQDEGWYLYAARLVRGGLQPYRDFAFTQAPVLPFVYALAQPVVDRFGVGGGRAFTWLLGLAGALTASALAGRLAGRNRGKAAALFAFTLIGVNVYQSYFTTIVKTYALCGLLLTAGVWQWLAALEKRSAIRAFIASTLFVLAAGTRISAAAAWPVAFVTLCMERRNFPRGWFAFFASAVLASVLVFLRWYLIAPDGFLFGVIEYHAGRHAGGLAQTLSFKLGFLSRVAQGYFVALALHALVIAWRRLDPEHVPSGPSRLIPVWWMVAAISLLHFVAPFPYDDYQALIFPLYAAAVAAALARCLRAEWLADRRVGAIAWALLLVCAAAAASSPINQSWLIRGRDRIWWKMRDKPALAKLREAGRWIRANAPPESRILTQDTYLAVEADRRVIPGFEMGPFSYYPDMPTDRARRLRVLNRELLIRQMQRLDKVPVAAISGYTFAIASPGVDPLPEGERHAFIYAIEQNFEKALEIPDFGQADTKLTLYRNLRKLR